MGMASPRLVTGPGVHLLEVPMNFQVELHNYCQFTCGYCPNKDMVRPRQFMPQEVWDAILNLYIVPYRYTNMLCPPTFIGHKDSEPLLDKSLPAKLRQLPPDMKIDVYSNGVLLPKWKERGQDFFEFLASLPNRARFLMSYHPHNHDGSINDYGPTVAYLQSMLRDPPRNVEFITVSHRSEWVPAELQEAWRRNWEGLPITVHSNCTINPWTGRIESSLKFGGCPYGDFGHWFFGCTGNVIACCLDLEEEIVLGNVLKDSPVDMFERTEAFYAEQRSTTGRPRHAVCDNCFGFDRQDRVQLGVL